MAVLKFLFFIFLVFLLNSVRGDKPCAARSISGESVVCVCNSTYCDTVTRDPPANGSYVAYISSEGGFRFNKTTGNITTSEYLGGRKVAIELDPDTKFQTIIGFGGAATDSAGINWRNLSKPLQKHLVYSYFSDHGLQYNMIRVPIGGSDFSTRPYAYNELPVNDTKLSNYSLSYEDFQYKLPLIKAGMELSNVPILLLATPWSPPPWMKNNNALTGHSRLLPQYYQTFADYIYKFIEKYAAEGVPIWGITLTNEPIVAVLGIGQFNSLGWVAENMGEWIVNNLGPTIRNSTFKDTKILAADDMRIFIFYWWNTMVEKVPKVLDYVDGVALHYYTDFLMPAKFQVQAMAPYPDKFLLHTEASVGMITWETETQGSKILRSWQTAYNFISDIITNLNHLSTGWIDWNLCLNSEGGPSWVNNFVDSPIIVFPERDEFIKQPMFYAMGHFSKFIPRGSKIIGTDIKKSFLTSIESVAVQTPENTIVVVFYNKGSARTVTIKLGDKLVSISCPKAALVTVELPNQP